MREIKFRAWDGNKMYYGESGFGFEGDGCYWANSIQGSVTSNHDATIMQYTGLKDKNGKEIYEGDILRANKIGKNYEVGFKQGAFVAGNNYLGQFVGYMDCEVIGNIYEGVK